MIFNRFNNYILMQIILIVLSSLAFAYTFVLDYMLITRYSLAVIILLQAFILINYINRISRNLTRFFNAFKYEDNKPVFSSPDKQREFSDLYRAFDRVIEQFKEVKIEKEKEYQFFSNALRHIGVGLLGFDENGKVLLINKTLLELFDLHHIANINELSKTDRDIPELLLKMNPDQTGLINIRNKGIFSQLWLKASVMKIEDKIIRLVSFQDIRPEIEQKEIDAWQRIIRVINHEIINSLSPVNLLSSTLLRSLEKGNKLISTHEIDKEIINNIHTGLKAIKGRSQGLTQFVEKYRKAMQLPEPKPEKLNISEMISEIKTLFREEFSSRNIKLKTADIPDDLTIQADRKMIEQVIVNLINNSLQAIEKIPEPEISIYVYEENHRKVIEISDNGKGIPTDNLENIFIPYFSTREGGSGIGLSLSRQIMRMHGGDISVASQNDSVTTFRLTF